MPRKYYRCIAGENLVLKTGAGTQGNSSCLDYIPGRAILGLVAKQYTQFSDPFAVFHNGKVQFGDAHPEMGNERSYKIPLSWFTKKGQNYHNKNKLIGEQIYIHHFMGSCYENFRQEGVQVKQIREGFFTLDGHKLSIEKSFALKSAYNPKKLRSREGRMFGYESVRAGTSWIFYVASDDSNLLQQIDDVLIKNGGRHGIGKSRSSQYGYVQIEGIDYQQNNIEDLAYRYNGNIYLYAESNLAFFDAFGQPCLLNDDLTKPYPGQVDPILPGTIDWNHTQVRVDVFTPWNNKRKARDHDRICLEKGSVIALKVADLDIVKWHKKWKNGLGAYLNEGMGKILINPSFLVNTQSEYHPKFLPCQEVTSGGRVINIIENHSTDAAIAMWLQDKTKEEQSLTAIYESINNFVEEKQSVYEYVSASQWSSIRNLVFDARTYGDIMQKLFDSETGFLAHGKSVSIWNEKRRREILKQEIESFRKEVGEDYVKAFVVKLSAEMTRNKNL